MGKWRMEGRVGLQGTDYYVQEWVPNPNPKRQGKYKWVADARDRKTAELIETAPELLAALEGLVEMLDSPRPHIQKARLQCRAKAALKKAKGMGKRLEEWVPKRRQDMWLIDVTGHIQSWDCEENPRGWDDAWAVKLVRKALRQDTWTHGIYSRADAIEALELELQGDSDA